MNPNVRRLAVGVLDFWAEYMKNLKAACIIRDVSKSDPQSSRVMIYFRFVCLFGF